MNTTKQEIFNKVCQHLFDQKQKAIDEKGNSAYRGTFGRVCPVGLFIIDSLYSKNYEKLGIGGVIDYCESVKVMRTLTDEEENCLNLLKEHRGLLAHLSLIQETTEFAKKTDLLFLYDMEKLMNNLIHAANIHNLNSDLIKKLCTPPKSNTRFVNPNDD